MNEIGTKIKELRRKKGLSQEELAENSKVNLRTIQRIEALSQVHIYLYIN